MQLIPLVLVLLGLFSNCLATLDKIADIIHDVVHNPSHPVDHRQPYYPQPGPYAQNGVYNRPYIVVTGYQHNRPQSQGTYYPQTRVYNPPARAQYYPSNSYGVGSDNAYDANVYGVQGDYYQGPPPTYRQNGYNNNNGHRSYPPQYRQRNVGTGLNGNGYNYNNNGYQSGPPPPTQQRHNNAAVSLNVVI